MRSGDGRSKGGRRREKECERSGGERREEGGCGVMGGVGLLKLGRQADERPPLREVANVRETRGVVGGAALYFSIFASNLQK